MWCFRMLIIIIIVIIIVIICGCLCTGQWILEWGLNCWVTRVFPLIMLDQGPANILRQVPWSKR